MTKKLTKKEKEIIALSQRLSDHIDSLSISEGTVIVKGFGVITKKESVSKNEVLTDD